MTKEINKVIIGKFIGWDTSVIALDLEISYNENKISISSNLDLRGLREHQEIKKIFNKNPENLFISKENFNKFMDIWGDLIDNNEKMFLTFKRTNPAAPEVFDFIRSLKVEDKHQDEVHGIQVNLDILKLKSNIEDQENYVDKLQDDSDKLKKLIDELKEEKNKLKENLKSNNIHLFQESTALQEKKINLFELEKIEANVDIPVEESKAGVSM